MTCSKKQQKEFVDDVKVDELIQIDVYKDIKLNRYFYDKANHRVLLYLPLRNRYQIVKPFPIKTNKNRNQAFCLIPAYCTKTKTLSFDKFFNYVVNKYGTAYEQSNIESINTET